MLKRCQKTRILRKNSVFGAGWMLKKAQWMLVEAGWRL